MFHEVFDSKLLSSILFPILSNHSRTIKSVSIDGNPSTIIDNSYR